MINFIKGSYFCIFIYFYLFSSLSNLYLPFFNFNSLKHHLDSAQDVITDIPKFYEYIGQILSCFYFKISDNERRSFFKETLKPCLVFDSTITIVINLIKHAIEREVCILIKNIILLFRN